MSTGIAWQGIGGLTPHRLLATRPHRHLLLPRAIAGLPLLGIGLVHLFDPAFGMRPLVEAAGLPFPAVLSPIGVALEIAAGVFLLLGLGARIGGLLAVSTMLVAVYAHLAIDTWPNGAENEPPLALPVTVMVSAAYVLWRGAGRWSLDHWHTPRPAAR